MDTNEVYMLLSIIEKTVGHGTQFAHIRSACVRRLDEINAEYAPEQPEVDETTTDEGVAEDNPATKREEEAENV